VYAPAQTNPSLVDGRRALGTVAYMPEPLLSHVDLMEWDLRRGRALFRLVGDVTVGWDETPMRSTVIARFRLSPQAELIEIWIRSDEPLRLRLDPRLVGRPAAPVPVTVYLDQNHWIALAREMLRMAPRAGEDRAAMRQLIEMSQSGMVALPLCSGRVAETTRVGHGRRVDLAAAQVSLSQGWALRNWKDVREQEVTGLLTGTPVRLTDVVTLPPAGVWSASLHSDPDDLVAEMFRGLSSMMAFYDTLLEDKALDATLARAAADEWAQAMQKTSYTVAKHKGRVARECYLRAVLVRDLTPEITAVIEAHPHLLPASRERLLACFTEHLGASPALSWLGALLTCRLRNSSDRWEGNDLIDMISLTTATAYCDVVLAERKFANLLSRCGQQLSGAQVVPSFRELGPILDALA